jgi:hypothetical protein
MTLIGGLGSCQERSMNLRGILVMFSWVGILMDMWNMLHHLQHLGKGHMWAKIVGEAYGEAGG